MLPMSTIGGPHFQGRLPPLQFQSPYLPAAFQPQSVSGK